MDTVYLDQNKWIDLARAYHGKVQDARLEDALAFVQESSASGTHVYPLSAIHYMETAKIRDSVKRGRLAEVMWELSGGRTMASYRLVLVHELETALAKRFPHVVPRPLVLISAGIAHAFGTTFRDYRLPEKYRSRVPKALADSLTRALHQTIEKSMLTGSGPGGITMPPFTMQIHERRFMEHLATLHPNLSQLPPDQWDDALHAITMADMLDPLNEVLLHHDLSKDDIEGLGKDGVKAFIADIPSRRLDLHLHRQVLRNPSLAPKLTDLEDWGGLGPAAAHCTFLICEKHFASLLLRDDFCPGAVVFTDLRDLRRLAGGNTAAA